MNRKKFLFDKNPSSSILNSPLYIAAALGLCSDQMPKTNVIFDLGGVLLDLSSFSLVRHIGFIKLLFYYCRMRYAPRDLFFEVLDRVDLPKVQNNNVCDEKGKLLPRAMFHWLCGTASSGEIKSAVEMFMEDNAQVFNNAEKQFIRSVVFSLFDPELFANTIKINKKGFAFVLECIKKGHNVYLLSNWDAESFELIRLRFPEFFELFDGIVISGSVGCAKPDPTIFYHLLEKYELCPEDTVFIDDQKENLKAAEALGIHPIKCSKVGRFFQKNDFMSVRKSFEDWHIERLVNHLLEKEGRKYPVF